MFVAKSKIFLRIVSLTRVLQEYQQRLFPIKPNPYIIITTTITITNTIDNNALNEISQTPEKAPGPTTHHV